MSHRTMIGALLTALTAIWSTPAAAQLPFQLYENWMDNGAPNLLLRSDRWVGTDFGGQEITREIRINAAGKPYLFLRTRQEGQTTDNTGSTFFASNGLRFRNPERVTRVEGVFKVTKMLVDTHCPANTSRTTEAQAEIFWVGFNDGSSTGSGDRTGDHQFQIRASRLANTLDPPGVLQVRGNVCRCSTPTCSTAACTGTQLPSIVPGKFTLQAIHDPAGANTAKFLVSVAGVQQTLGYPSTTPPSPQMKPAVSNFGYVNAGGSTANCTVASGGPKEFDVEVQVLKVKTNPEAIVP